MTISSKVYINERASKIANQEIEAARRSLINKEKDNICFPVFINNEEFFYPEIDKIILKDVIYTENLNGGKIAYHNSYGLYIKDNNYYRDSLLDALKRATKYLKGGTDNFTLKDDRKISKLCEFFSKKVDGFEIIYCRVSLSNKDYKKIMSGKYGIDYRIIFEKSIEDSDDTQKEKIYKRIYKREVFGVTDAILRYGIKVF